MTLGELPSTAHLIYLVLGVLVFLLLISQLAVQQRAKKRIGHLERTIASLQQDQSEVFGNLEARANAIKEMLFEKTNPLTNKLNELSKKANTLLERYDGLRQDFEQQVSALKAAGDETTAKLTSSHDAVRKVVQEGKSEIERMGKEVGEFAVEIKKMKDFVRERTLDLEL